MIIIGHRGARGEAPENTLAAFRHAADNGTRHFELDVRLARDERPVVVHDSTVDRTTGEAGAIANLTAAQLAALDARQNTAGWQKPVGIPTLEEILVACPLTKSWQLEIKADKPARIKMLVIRMAELLDRLHMAEQVTLTSLDTNVLKTARREAPELQRGYVAETANPEPLSTAKKLDCKLLVSNWLLTNETLIKQAQLAGIAVSVWTVNDLVVAERMRSLNVDSLITDFPTAMLAHNAMRERLHAGRR